MCFTRSSLRINSYPVLTALSLLFVTCIGLTFVTSRDAIASESPLQAAPAFSLPGVEGHKSLNDYQGRYVYVDFWASWCGPCRESFPWMNEMLTKYNTQGLQIIAINLDESRDDANRFLQTVQADVDIAFDASGKTAEAFNVIGMPSSYLIDPDGKIVFSHVGFRPRDTVKLEAVIAKLIRDSA